MNEVCIPLALVPVFEPDFGALRYRGAYGGRGSGKSRSFAVMAAYFGTRQPMRILATREFQNSIKESFYAEVAGAIEDLPALRDFYDIGESFIRGRNGTEFIFRGLRHNMTAIKSMARIDLCIVEEAEDVPESSWRDLIPTIRADGSEIWVIWNPRKRASPVDARFRLNPPERSAIARVNYSENPWFPAVLDEERRNDRARLDPDTYAHIWEGEYLEHSAAQVLHGKVQVREFTPEPDWDGAYFGADWGFAQDPTALVKCWVFDGDLYIEHEAYQHGVEIDHLPALFERIPGARDYLIRADSARPETISFMSRQGFRITAAAKGKGSVEDGVAHLRGYRHIIIHPRCTHTINESRLWSYRVDRLSGDILPELVDAHNHAWDAVRYALEPLMRQRRAIGAPVITAASGQRRF